MLTLGSLFDGIGGWQLAAVHAGIMPVWSSEIEAFPLALTARRFPYSRQLGDISKIDGAQIEPVDIVCAGSPCQDLSVAGNQRGLQGERSGLFRDAIRIIRRMRTATGGDFPRFFVWENVPGAFGSNRGNDFRAVLEEITESKIPIPASGRWAAAGMVRSGICDAAWRVLDAQFWGVPQRRKRIFIVADFGTRGRCADKILFERAGVRGDIAEGGEKGERIAARTESRVGNASGDCLTPWDAQGKRIFPENGKSPCLAGSDGGGGRNPAGLVFAARFKAGQSRAGGLGYEIEKAATLAATHSGVEPTVAVFDMTHADEVMRRVPDGRAPTLNARMGPGGNQVPVASYAIAGNIIGREDKNGGHQMGVDKDVSFTLNTVDRHAVCVGNGQLDNARLQEKVGALNCMHDQQMVMVASVDCRGGRESEVSGTLQTKSGNLNFNNPVRVEKTVRRLTPLECERLQGLPDNYTLIDDKSCSDTARYKALGNGMAQPCADWIIKKIVEAVEHEGIDGKRISKNHCQDMRL